MQIPDPFDPGSGIRDGKIQIRDKTATLIVIIYKSIENFVQNFDLEQHINNALHKQQLMNLTIG
jgi:hypothetical protein